MIIAIDFNGTICSQSWPAIGAEVPGAAAAIRKMYDAGHVLILWTCREDESLLEALAWLAERKLFRCFSYVNGNCINASALFGTDPRKVGADWYVDDKAVGCPKAGGLVDWAAVERAILAHDNSGGRLGGAAAAEGGRPKDAGPA